MEAEYQVHLANPAALQQYSGLKYTDDHSDARWLAHLLRLGVLPEGYIYPKAERAVRVRDDGEVTLFAVTSTISANGDQGADPNKLVRVTDRLDSSPLPTGDDWGRFVTIRSPPACRPVPGKSSYFAFSSPKSRGRRGTPS